MAERRTRGGKDGGEGTSGGVADAETRLVKRVMKENGGLDPARALAVLARTLVERHVDCELRKRGKRPAWTPGNERTNALTAALDAIFQAKAARTGTLGAAPRNQFAPPDPEADALQALIQLLLQCQIAAEHKLGMDKDDDDDRPMMRLVTD
jgi:hypothetical protein